MLPVPADAGRVNDWSEQQADDDRSMMFDRLKSRWAWFVAPVALAAWFAMLWLMFGDVL